MFLLRNLWLDHINVSKILISIHKILCNVSLVCNRSYRFIVLTTPYIHECFVLFQSMCIHRMLPVLFSECSNRDMIPFVLQNILVIADRCSKQEYSQHIFPKLIPIFKISKPIQVFIIITLYLCACWLLYLLTCRYL